MKLFLLLIVIVAIALTAYIGYLWRLGQPPFDQCPKFVNLMPPNRKDQKFLFIQRCPQSQRVQ
ncbi:hypothetical protein A3A49_02465 [Candidatus Curtissbacteria bacterium RIFCSPLOWO2_01_FULL_38_11b]|uniref:Uncharacterized protein n=1 Tax=Candidatus Curtissbacteria bacterium RIFCSPLOWO2_01_FULL_38_11b TaxID=1797725 RepID=A0A1F5GYV6_9BACT|nr:MAG: hypothetical protein A3A49_02465 [Candidatus Curtissbacteria bacterium RIFCSPLOWO2_01_FULL_38_11b]